jgi:hypothetical protein
VVECIYVRDVGYATGGKPRVTQIGASGLPAEIPEMNLQGIEPKSFAAALRRGSPHASDHLSDRPERSTALFDGRGNDFPLRVVAQMQQFGRRLKHL